ncbi:MAG: HAD hydrolase family protein [Lentisphaeria bacterium]|nr:HAD hydrolase family protein [Lentisphaeria bacterium]
MITSEQFKKIKLVLTDIDGVLTDGRVGYGADDFIKFFNYKDGHWIRMAMRAGIMVGFLSGRKCLANERRSQELGVTFCLEDVKDKGPAFEQILKDYDLAPEECLYIGDDVIDVPVMIRCGISAAPADAISLLDRYIDWRVSRNGGYGVLYEVIERLLRESGKLDALLERYCKES